MHTVLNLILLSMLAPAVGVIVLLLVGGFLKW